LGRATTKIKRIDDTDISREQAALINPTPFVFSPKLVW
jgi:hypothetical protein